MHVDRECELMDLGSWYWGLKVEGKAQIWLSPGRLVWTTAGVLLSGRVGALRARPRV